MSLPQNIKLDFSQLSNQGKESSQFLNTTTTYLLQKTNEVLNNWLKDCLTMLDIPYDLSNKNGIKQLKSLLEKEYCLNIILQDNKTVHQLVKKGRGETSANEVLAYLEWTIDLHSIEVKYGLPIPTKSH